MRAAEHLGRAFLTAAQEAEATRWLTAGTLSSTEPVAAIVDGTEVALAGYVGTLPAVGERCVIGILRGAAGVRYVLIGPPASGFCVAGLPVAFESVAFETGGLGSYLIQISGHEGQTAATINGTIDVTTTPPGGYPAQVWVEVTPPAPFSGTTYTSDAIPSWGFEGVQDWTVDVSAAGAPIDGIWTLAVTSGEAGASTLDKLCVSFTAAP